MPSSRHPACATLLTSHPSRHHHHHALLPVFLLPLQHNSAMELFISLSFYSPNYNLFNLQLEHLLAEPNSLQDLPPSDPQFRQSPFASSRVRRSLPNTDQIQLLAT